MQKRFEICPASELEPGQREIVELNGVSVGVFNVDGEYHALKNDCPHQRAPLCEGKLTGTVTAEEPGDANWECEGRILRCPWHGWEFEVESGESVFNPHKVKARSFEATVEAPDEEDAAEEDAAEEDAAEEDATENADASACDCGAELAGDEPPIDTYETEVENDQVVVYL